MGKAGEASPQVQHARAQPHLLADHRVLVSRQEGQPFGYRISARSPARQRRSLSSACWPSRARMHSFCDAFSCHARQWSSSTCMCAHPMWLFCSFACKCTWPRSAAVPCVAPGQHLLCQQLDTPCGQAQVGVLARAQLPPDAHHILRSQLVQPCTAALLADNLPVASCISAILVHYPFSSSVRGS